MTFKAPRYAIGETVVYTGANPKIVGSEYITITSRFHHELGWKYKVPKIDGFTWVFEDNLRLPDAQPAPPPGWALNKLNPVAPEQNPEEILGDKVLAMWGAEVAAAEARKAVADEMKAQEEAEARKALEDAAEARVAALQKRLGYDLLLAAATSLLLQAIARDIEGYEPQLKKELAKFRHELQPLAETYGYAIVPVGDGSRATISMI